MKIKKNDNVLIISGKDKGKRAVVQKILPKTDKIVVTGINISKRHLKPSRKNPHGGILDIPSPIHISNAVVVCPHCGAPTRVGYKISGDVKERICRKCKANLSAEVNNAKS